MLDSIPFIGWLIRNLARRKGRTSLSVSVTVNGNIKDSVVNINVNAPDQRVDLGSREIDVDVGEQPPD